MWWADSWWDKAVCQIPGTGAKQLLAVVQSGEGPKAAENPSVLFMRRQLNLGSVISVQHALELRL